jgi:hypothetical protein
VFQEEVLIVMSRTPCLREPGIIRSGDLGLPHQVCLYPDQGLVFVEGLGVDVPLDQTIRSEWIEEGRPR